MEVQAAEVKVVIGGNCSECVTVCVKGGLAYAVGYLCIEVAGQYYAAFGGRYGEVNGVPESCAVLLGLWLCWCVCCDD